MARDSWETERDHSNLTGRIRRFFFAEEIPYGMAISRMALSLVLLGDAAYRWAYARELYSSDGATAQLGGEFGFPNFLPEFPATLIVPLHTLLLCVLLTSCVGWCTRFSLWTATVLNFYFGMMDSLSTLTKYTVIAEHALLLLSLSQAGAVWSVDAWLQGKGRRIPGSLGPLANCQPVPVWPQRLMQIMVGMVYLGSALTKMHTPLFFSGDQMLYWMMTNVTSSHPVGEYLSQYPLVSVVSPYACIVWEVLFLFCSWRGWGRILMVSIGVFFHLGTWLMLGLTVFPMVMFAIYLAFLNQEDVQWLGHQYRWLRRKCLGKLRPWQALAHAIRLDAWRAPQVNRIGSAAAFTLTLGLIAFTGTEIEYRLDYYGERRPSGPYPLRELTSREVQEILSPEAPLREEDKFLSFDIGTMLLGGRLCNRLSSFRQKEKILCEANLNPPHEDMFLECNLHDAQDRVISRVGQTIAHEMLRAHFNYVLNEGFVPGEYSLVLKSRGREITRRKFNLLPALSAPVAN